MKNRAPRTQNTGAPKTVSICPRLSGINKLTGNAKPGFFVVDKEVMNEFNSSVLLNRSGDKGLCVHRDI